MKRLRRWLLVVLVLVISLLVLAFVFISPITKYLIEKYDVTYTGRQITMDKLFLNFFTGNASIKGFTLYEKDGKTPFFKCGELSVSIKLRKILSGEYDIRHFTAESPEITIVQKGEHYNYDDFLDKIMGPADTTTKKSNAEPLHLYINNIAIKNFSVTYTNTLPYNTVKLQKGNCTIEKIAWNDPVYNIGLDFGVATGGEIKSKTNYNSKNGAFKLALDVNSFNIAPLHIYLKDYMKVNSLNGAFSTSLNIAGNSNNPTAIAAGGNLSLDTFTIVDNTNEKLMACQRFEIKVDSINTEKSLYDFSTITLQRPYVKFAMYDDGFNYERLMTSPAAASGVSDSSTSYANVFEMTASYIDELVKNYVINSYNADKLLVTGGTVVFTDYTLEDKFQYVLDSLNLLSDRINSNNSRIAFEASSLLNRSGAMKGSLYMNPANPKDLEMDIAVSHLLVSDFNPYSKYYVATPFLDGDAFYTNKTTIRNRKLDNQNQLDVYKIKAGKKVKNSTAMNIPVKLAVSLLKDVKGDIHLKIPVTGSLDDPKFKWGKVVWQVFKNLMVKAASAPFNLLAGKFGGAENDYKEIVFSYELQSLTAKQEAQLEKLVQLLQKEEEVKLELVPMLNQQDETEYVAAQMARREFLNMADTSVLNPEQQKLVDGLSLKDSAFDAFLDKKIGNTRLQSAQDKCIQFIGTEKIAARVALRHQRRRQAITDFFVKTKGIAADRIYFTEYKGPDPLSRNEPPKYLVNVSMPGEDKVTEEKEPVKQ